jgi:hypothetical protein
VERESPPSSPAYKYQNEKTDYAGLDSISEERSFALRISDNFRIERTGTNGDSNLVTDVGLLLEIVEAPYTALDVQEDWNGLPNPSPSQEEEKPLEERWEEKELIRSLLCSESFPASSEFEAKSEKGSEEVESSGNSQPRPTVRMVNEIEEISAERVEPTAQKVWIYI